MKDPVILLLDFLLLYSICYKKEKSEQRLGLLKNQGNVLSYRTLQLQKQFTGLFLNSSFAEHLKAVFRTLLRPPPETPPLDSAKGTLSLWNPIFSRQTQAFIFFFSFCGQTSRSCQAFFPVRSIRRERMP